MGNRLCMNCKPCKDQLDIDCENCKAKVRAEAIEEVLKKVYKHFQNHSIEFGKDEVLDELSQIIDEYYILLKLEEKQDDM